MASERPRTRDRCFEHELANFTQEWKPDALSVTESIVRCSQKLGDISKWTWSYLSLRIPFEISPNFCEQYIYEIAATSSITDPLILPGYCSK